MTTKTRPWEPCDVRTHRSEPGSSPMAFLWRGRLHTVREVNAIWNEQDATIYRVTASRGRAFSDAVYDLRLLADLWAIQQVRDY